MNSLRYLGPRWVINLNGKKTNNSSILIEKLANKATKFSSFFKRYPGLLKRTS